MTSLEKYFAFLAERDGIGIAADWYTNRDGELCADVIRADDRIVPVRLQYDDRAWQAHVGVKTFRRKPSDLDSPMLDTPQEALAWLKTAIEEWAPPTCDNCRDTGVYSWCEGDQEGTDFCACDIGQAARGRVADERAEARRELREEGVR